MDDIRRLRAALATAGLPDGRPSGIAIAGNASPAWHEPFQVDLPLSQQSSVGSELC